MAEPRKTIVPTAQIWFDAARKYPKHPEAVLHMENAFNHTENALGAARKENERLRQSLHNVGAMVFMNADGHVQFKPDFSEETVLDAVNGALEPYDLLRPATNATSPDMTTPEGRAKAIENARYYRETLKPFA